MLGSMSPPYPARNSSRGGDDKFVGILPQVVACPVQPEHLCAGKGIHPECIQKKVENINLADSSPAD